MTGHRHDPLLRVSVPLPASTAARRPRPAGRRARPADTRSRRPGPRPAAIHDGAVVADIVVTPATSPPGRVSGPAGGPGPETADGPHDGGG
jgi:hypothetical protein